MVIMGSLYSLYRCNKFFYILQINVEYSWVQIKLLLLQAFIIDITHMDDSLYLIFPPIFEKVVKWSSGSFEFYLLVRVTLHECHSIRGHSRDVSQQHPLKGPC